MVHEQVTVLQDRANHVLIIFTLYRLRQHAWAFIVNEVLQLINTNGFANVRSSFYYVVGLS